MLLLMLLLLLQSRAFSLSAMLQPDNGPSMIIRAACDGGGGGDGGDHVLERERDRKSVSCAPQCAWTVMLSLVHITTTNCTHTS